MISRSMRSIVILLCTFFGAHASAKVGSVCEPLFKATIGIEQLENSRNISQVIRSNSIFYWDYLSRAVPNSLLASFAKFEGYVSGDAHVGNATVLPVLIDGRRNFRLLNIDFDNAGYGPFALDFLNYVVNAKAVDSNINVRDLVNEYVSGLKHEKRQFPKAVRAALETSEADYAKSEDKYVARKTAQAKFILEAGELEAGAGGIPLKQIVNAFPGKVVLDVATRPIERGGSFGTLRLWVLVLEASGQQRIWELKEAQETALTRYRKQQPLERRINGIRDAFWAGISGETYDLVQLDGRSFWKREKKIDFSKLDDGVDFKKDALFKAWSWGTWHGNQASAKPYIALIESDRDGFRLAIRDETRKLLAVIEQAIEREHRKR